MSFKERLREEISFQGLLLKEVASKSGISKRTIESYVDSRERMPLADIAVKIAQALGVSVEYLVTGADSSIPKEFESYARYREVLLELNKLSDETWETIKPLLLGMINSAKKAELEKNLPKVSSH